MIKGLKKLKIRRKKSNKPNITGQDMAFGNVYIKTSKKTVKKLDKIPDSIANKCPAKCPVCDKKPIAVFRTWKPSGRVSCEFVHGKGKKTCKKTYNT